MDFSDKEKRKAYLRERGIIPIRIPIPLIIDHINVYYIDGPTPVLIDTGFFGEACFAALAAGLSPYGKGVADIGIVLLTHGHPDHSGMARNIHRASGARVLLHERDSRLLAPHSFSDYFDRVFAYYLDMGVESEKIRQIRSSASAEQEHYREEAGDDNREIIGGFIQADDRFESGAGPIRVVETPGHTKGSVSFLLEEDNILFSGDLISTVYDPLPLVMVEREADGWLNMYDRFRDSLDLVADLDPALLFPGHGGAISQARRLSRRIADVQERVTEQVEQALRSNGDQTIASLAGMVYPNAFGPLLTNALNLVRGIAIRLARQSKVQIDGGRVIRLHT
jgi:glyoxylase-like metal-dependent hydrolase (beta-lactamase superfamily II)